MLRCLEPWLLFGGPRLSLRHPYGGSQLSVVPVPWPPKATDTHTAQINVDIKHMNKCIENRLLFGLLLT